MLHSLVQWLLTIIGSMGYAGIFALMALESSLFPVPSELVMPPAGYLIHAGEMSWFGVIMAGTIGSLVGAYANYFAAHYLGRPLVLRYGRYFFLTEEKLCTVERFFQRHGAISTFIGRLLPVIRHFISIPAGLAGMRHTTFAFYTLLGAGIWCTILTIIGYLIGKNEALIILWTHRAINWIVIVCSLLIVCYVYVQRRREPSTSTTHEEKY